MFCSGCGQVLNSGQGVCPQCGRAFVPVAAMPAGFSAPTMPVYEFQLVHYASKVRTLGILWLVFSGLSLILGFAALAFAKALFAGGFGPWMNGPWAHGPWSHGGPMPPTWFLPMAIHFAWLFLTLRAVLCAIAGWGLLQRTEWGRILAIIVAIISLIKFPFGTALGIATLVILLGYRNAMLYEQL
jgi:hypothetical protein